LGNPDKQLHKDEAKTVLPMFKRSESKNINDVLNLSPTTVFVPSGTSSEDWKIIIEQLAI